MDQQKDTTMFLAASRIYKEGQAMLHLICPSSGFYRYYPESFLQVRGINLGDFLRAKFNTSTKEFEDFEKTTHTANLTVKVNGNLVTVENIRATLEELPNGERVFQNKLFPNAYCPLKDIPLGKYTISVRALYPPKKIEGSKKTISFFGHSPFPFHPKPAEIPVVVGNGFAPPPEQKIIGSGFSQNDKVIRGSGFEANNTPKGEKLKAVVLNTSPGKGAQIHYLWLLEKHEECSFSKSFCTLGKGHVFEGTFVKDPSGYYKLKSYEKPISGLVSGGLDAKDRCWFNVKVENFKAKSFNAKYNSVKSECFGEILDVDDKLTEGCNGQEVKIQRRRGTEDTQYYWMVI